KNDGTEAVDVNYYRSLIGSLLYLTATRPDIMYVTSLLSRFMHQPSMVHLGAARRVLRYIRGISDFGLNFTSQSDVSLKGYTDSDWAGSLEDSKSTSGYVFSLGSAAFSWGSKKQQIVARSIVEAEYVAASSAVNQALWLRKILADIGEEQAKATP